MPKILDALVANGAYAFVAVGVAWAGVATVSGSALTVWPVVACIAAGVQLRMWPARRLTWAWVVSTAVMGFVLSAYQVYTWVGFVGNSIYEMATSAQAGFSALAAIHVLLFYLGTAKPAAAESVPG